MIAYSHYEKIDFMIKKGDASFINLDTDLKFTAFKIGITNNRSDWVRELITFPELVVRLKSMSKSLISEAVYHDFPEILEIIIETVSEINIQEVAKSALSQMKVNTIEYLKTRTCVFDDPYFLLSLAEEAIPSYNRALLLEIIAKMDLNRTGEESLLTAVKADGNDIIKYLLDSLKLTSSNSDSIRSDNEIYADISECAQSK